MMLGDMTRSALSNLGRRKVRTVLTAIGVVVGILTIVTMVSLGIGVRAELNEQFAAIGLERVFVRPAEGNRNFFTQFRSPKRTKPILEADVALWRTWPEAVEVLPDVELPLGVASALTLNGKTNGVGITGQSNFNTPFLRPPTALAGTLDVPPTGGVAVVNRGALEELELTVDEVRPLIGRQVELMLETPQGDRRTFPLTLIGISSNEAPFVEVALQDRVAMKSWWFNTPDLLETQGYDQVILRGRDTTAANALVDRIKAEGYQVQSLQILLDLADQVFSVINIMLSSVGGLALLVAMLGIVNTMIMSIYERTREIGTLKAIGASRGDIRALFMIEAGMLGLLGGLTGLVLGWGLGKVLNRVILWYVERNDLPIQGNFFVVTPTLALAAVGFATLIGIVAGLYPANRAARLDPLLALRHE
ncbi:MAG TPA: ABC transporter permease [Herpetosiphonaceae bacterium]|nr:ABC transporter permease [Herpetosiphonaceae bacterium]